MRKSTPPLLLAGLFAASCAFAGHEDHVAEPEKAGAIQDDARKKSVPLADRMLQNIGVQMEAIRNSDDPEERRRLLRNHLQSMREVLDLMALADAHADADSTASPALPAGTEGGDKGEARQAGKMGGKDGMKHGMKHGMPMHSDLQERVERLQKLIEQIIEHEQAEGEQG